MTRSTPGRKVESRLDAMRHCFLFCCERAGSSASVRLLHGHPQVIMGQERYRLLCRRVLIGRPLEVSPAHFRPERFFEFRETDTTVRPPRLIRHYEIARKRVASGSARIIGDKILPPDRRIVPQLLEKFPAAKCLMLWRDPFDVAASFTRLANDQRNSWPAANDHVLAVEHWNEAAEVFRVLQELLPSEQLMVVSTDELFAQERGARVVDAILTFLDLPDSAGFRKRNSGMVAAAPRRLRGSGLGSDARDWVDREVDWNAHSRLAAATKRALLR